MCSIEKYHIAHILHTNFSGEIIAIACATRHLYAANRIRGPVIVICASEAMEEWEEVFRTYTLLKVTVMSGSHKSLWNNSKRMEVYGELNGMLIWDLVGR